MKIHEQYKQHKELIAFKQTILDNPHHTLRILTDKEGFLSTICPLFDNYPQFNRHPIIVLLSESSNEEISHDPKTEYLQELDDHELQYHIEENWHYINRKYQKCLSLRLTKADYIDLTKNHPKITISLLWKDHEEQLIKEGDDKYVSICNARRKGNNQNEGYGIYETYEDQFFKIRAALSILDEDINTKSFYTLLGLPPTIEYAKNSQRTKINHNTEYITAERLETWINRITPDKPPILCGMGTGTDYMALKILMELNKKSKKILKIKMYELADVDELIEDIEPEQRVPGTSIILRDFFDPVMDNDPKKIENFNKMQAYLINGGFGKLHTLLNEFNGDTGNYIICTSQFDTTNDIIIAATKFDYDIEYDLEKTVSPEHLETCLNMLEYIGIEYDKSKIKAETINYFNERLKTFTVHTKGIDDRLDTLWTESEVVYKDILRIRLLQALKATFDEIVNRYGVERKVDDCEIVNIVYNEFSKIKDHFIVIHGKLHNTD